MAFTATITFHGSIAVVPKYAVDDKTDKPEDKAIYLVIPSFTDTGLAKNPVAYIRFPKDSLTSKRALAGKSADTGLQHLILNGELLDIDAAADPSPLDADFDHELEETPTNKDMNSLHWLPNLGRLMKSTPGSPSPILDPDLLASPFKATATASLAARIMLRHGTLRTGGVKAALPFVTGNVEEVHQVAREAILTLNIPGNSLRIASAPVDGSASNGANDMVFVPPSGSNSLELVIGNEPQEDIYAASDEMAAVASNDPAEEFGLYYRLCKPVITSGALPLGKNKGGSTQLCAVSVVNGG